MVVVPHSGCRQTLRLFDLFDATQRGSQVKFPFHQSITRPAKIA